MREYVIRRLFQTILTIYVVASVLFILFRMVPGDPTAQVISPALSKPAQERLKRAYGLDKPLHTQYFLYLKNLALLRWGRSFTTSYKVFDMLAYRFWNTVFLMGAAMFFALSGGILGGIVMAWRRDSPIDILGTVGSLIVRSAPPFVTGLALLILLSYRLDLFPTGGMHTPGFHPESLVAKFASWDFIHHLILPTITVTLYYLATPALIMRTSMLEVLGSDYIELAKAKGLHPRRVMFKHAARNALLAVVTVSSIMIGFAIGGQVLVEQVFSWPGMAKLMVDAAASQDYPVAQGSFLLMSALVVTLNFLADLTYAYLDPRISYEKKS